jgi:hypothetical protein
LQLVETKHFETPAPNARELPNTRHMLWSCLTCVQLEKRVARAAARGHAATL